MSRALSFGLALGIVAVAQAALADDAPKVEKGVTTTPTVYIHGRPARPNVAITVARVPLEASVRVLKQPLVERIAKSADKPPF
jgi:hypothetical protein